MTSTMAVAIRDLYVLAALIDQLASDVAFLRDPLRRTVTPSARALLKSRAKPRSKTGTRRALRMLNS